ncbi:MAG TPA: hypothetical protein VJS44_09885 [Pyrinomonadaceae bacterium]|nr:hypothetical protein [Pyrinomonadaceae bacterium]
MNRLDVKTSKLSFILVILLGLFLVPLSLMNLMNGLLKGFAPVPLGLGLMMLVIYGAVVWLVRRGHAKSVKYFSAEGLVCNDGRSFRWAELSRVVNQIRIDPARGNRKLLWRTEIQFKNGESAWLLPTKVSNFREVSEYVNNLPCEHAEVRV